MANEKIAKDKFYLSAEYRQILSNPLFCCENVQRDINLIA